VKAYLKILRSLHGRRQIAIDFIETVYFRPTCRLSPSIQQQIWDSLPPPPWPKDIYKQTAAAFHVSKSDAWAAIALFVESHPQTRTVVAETKASADAERQ
jgi:hypothetical protein